MEKFRRRATITNRGMEENTMAILESFCAHDSSHVHDDRLAFLEAVRFASIVPENGTPPTNKMMEAIFEIMREAKSLELVVASYQLLCELEKHFPRVYLSNEDVKEAPSSKSAKLIVFEEAWLPFAVGSDMASSDRSVVSKGFKEPISPSGFKLLLESLNEEAEGIESSETKLELLAKMYMLQYLIYIFEADFLPRNRDFLENSNWISLKDSLLNKFLGSRRINYKDVAKDTFFVLCNLFLARTPTNSNSGTTKSSSDDMHNNNDSALALSLPEVEKCTLKAVEKLLKLMINLDLSKKKADAQSLTTRADGPSTRKRKLDDSQDDTAVIGFFNCFLNSTSTKAIVKKVGAEAVQVMLAHALQACMSIPKEQLHEVTSDSKNDARRSPLVNICNNIISAFTKLRETDEHLQILPIGKEALFTAASVLSTKS